MKRYACTHCTAVLDSYSLLNGEKHDFCMGGTGRWIEIPARLDNRNLPDLLKNVAGILREMDPEQQSQWIIYLLETVGQGADDYELTFHLMDTLVRKLA